MKFVLSIVVAFAVILLQAIPVHADVNNFVINDFSAEYVLQNDVTGGSLETYEKIDLTFSDQNHGIFRYVPKDYKGYSTKLEIRSVARDGVAEPYTTYTENDNLVLKIGDPSVTITGSHSYEIKYYQERIVNFEEGAEFYWDVNGNGWQQPFENVSAKLSFKGFDFSAQEIACYTGYQGASGKDCSYSVSDEMVSFTTTRSLSAGEGLTVAASLPEGVFAEPTWKDTLRDNIENIIGIFLGILGLIYALMIWNKYGKDYKKSGVIIPEYEPPKDLSPAEVGMMADFRVDSRDLSATLIDLAVRKYVRLHENEKKVFFVKSKSYSVELINTDFSGLKSHEKDLLEGIFGDAVMSGLTVDLSKLNKTQMSTHVQKSRENIRQDLINKHGMIESKIPRSLVVSIFLVIAFGILAFVLKSGGFFVGLVLFAAGVFFAGIFMQRRNHAGVEAYEKIMGLKLYMDVAEKQRLKMMQSVDRPYAAPEKTVHLFEKLLPYAVALGVERSWAKQFDGIMKENPQWITSNSATAFSSAHLASSITSVSSNFSSSFSTTTSSGSSGGGSSGGGGGGGGGGGW